MHKYNNKLDNADNIKKKGKKLKKPKKEIQRI